MNDACWCDYDPPEFFAQSQHTARVRHKCSECGGPIRSGELYIKIAGKWDGDMCFFKRCCNCDSLLMHYEAHVPCFCWAYGQMLSDMREDIYHRDELRGTGLLFELGRLAVNIRRNRELA